ncbi:MAG TPA: metal-dependent transcriptional regulator [bacterium]|nr:metal-dependent transcriptional regulator [bacterium]
MDKQLAEEILQAVWELREDGTTVTADALRGKTALNGIDLVPALAALTAAGELQSAAGQYTLQAGGENRARMVIRKHRLTERLFHDVLRYRGEHAERDACELEHVISEDAIDHICTLLGHPATCPDGKPVPDGPCCREHRRNICPLVFPLTELEPGLPATVVYIECADGKRLDKLSSFGLIPGETVVVRQRTPSFVVMLGHTQLAFDRALAGTIYVRRA